LGEFQGNIYKGNILKTIVMVNQKESEGYELVPENKFKEIEKEVSKIMKSPFISDPSVKEMGGLLKAVNASLISLLEVLQIISEETSFENAEKNLIKRQIKPIVKEIDEVKKQNEIITEGMMNIIGRLNDMQTQLITIQRECIPFPQSEPNPNLPPISGGITPPDSNVGG